jgi:hypothetical protein
MNTISPQLNILLEVPKFFMYSSLLPGRNNFTSPLEKKKKGKGLA